MISSPEVSSNFFEAVLCEVSCEVHAYLAGEGDGPASFFALEISQPNVISACDGGENIFNGYFNIFKLDH